MILDTSESLKRVPLGFPADCPDAEYLKLKNFCLTSVPDDAFITAPNLVDRLAEIFQTTKPFLDFINRAVDFEKQYIFAAAM